MKRIALFITALIAFAAIAAEVQLRWDAHPDEVQFRLHWGTESGVYTQHTEVGTNLTATIVGLTSGRTYFFAATAYNDFAESDYSNEVTYDHILAAPSTLRVEATVNVTVTITQPK